MGSIDIKEWLLDGYENGFGDGDGSGFLDGDGYGNGDRYGNGIGDRYGDGYGNGDGDGCGSIYGSGYGRGGREGSGVGFGNGYGNGDRSGYKSYNGQQVHCIDDTPTIIESIHGNIAKAFIIKAMLLVPCYVAKVHGFFAHGKTSRQALADAMEKYEQNMPLEERISNFIEKFPTLDTLADNKDLFEWHNKLTGSCDFGRREFANVHGIDVENGKMTIFEFVQLTKDAYRGECIKQLEKAYKATVLINRSL